MKRLTRLSVLTLLVTGLLVPTGAASTVPAAQDTAAQDTPSHGSPAQGTVATTDTKIQGVAVDGDGRGVDDVTVQALDASTGAPVATALTYASARPDGAQHGYFYLLVPPGVYDVALVKRGYDPRLLGDLDVTGTVSLGELELGLRDRPTRTSARVRERVVGPRQPVLVKAVVTSRKAEVTGGKLVVSEGRRRLAVHALSARDRGRATLDLGRLSRGTHRLTVEYRGVDGLEGSTARPVRVTVATRAGRTSGRPLPR